MKKMRILFVGLFLAFALQGQAQTTSPTDFFAGKWEIFVADTPYGDITLLTDLVRTEGKLTGQLVSKTDPNTQFPITSIEENEKGISIFFDAPDAGQVSIDLQKKADDLLEGLLANFEAIAKRIKE